MVLWKKEDCQAKLSWSNIERKAEMMRFVMEKVIKLPRQKNMPEETGSTKTERNYVSKKFHILVLLIFSHNGDSTRQNSIWGGKKEQFN